MAGVQELLDRVNALLGRLHEMAPATQLSDGGIGPSIPNRSLHAALLWAMGCVEQCSMPDTSALLLAPGISAFPTVSCQCPKDSSQAGFCSL